ncbi:RNA-binding protein [Candidatus Daviesbacteria bacterium]|nr:RNA-binding protein [Candidatus Daviesbacteria bacterium]
MTNQQLEEMFTKFGSVQSVKIIVDLYTGNSKGFAFVEMASDDEAQEAIKQLNGFGIEGRKMGVSVAKPKEDHQNRSNFRSDNSRGSRSNFLRGSNRR